MLFLLDIHHIVMHFMMRLQALDQYQNKWQNIHASKHFSKACDRFSRQVWGLEAYPDFGVGGGGGGGGAEPERFLA